MRKLILVRYGEHENGSLTEAGRVSMRETAEKLAVHTIGVRTTVLAGDATRSIESAEEISKELKVSPPYARSELYAEPEKGILPDVSRAYTTIVQTGMSCDIVIAVLSREYIEELPNYVHTKVFEKGPYPTRNLARGEVLVIDFETESIY